jgi:hypothetical protein
MADIRSLGAASHLASPLQSIHFGLDLLVSIAPDRKIVTFGQAALRKASALAEDASRLGPDALI